MPPPNIVVFASGNGTNAEAIALFYKRTQKARISLIMSNNKDAYVHQRAARYNIPTFTFSKADLFETDVVLNRLLEEKPALIALAGFMWLMPEKVLRHFPDRIINVHPALLPNFGGKGMYGSKVHEAVLASGFRESGITVHFVNEHYDDGKIIFQTRCPVLPDDSPESLAKRIHMLEHWYYPKVVNYLLFGGKPVKQAINYWPGGLKCF